MAPLPPLAPSTITPSTGPANRGPASATGGLTPDYVVKKGDTLWGIAKALVVQQGGQPTNPTVARMLQELKAENPHLTTPARKGGDVIFPNDPVVYPRSVKAGAPDGWQGTPTDGQPRTPTAQEQAAAQQQMQQLDQAKAVDASQFAQAVTAQVNTVAEAVSKLQQPLTPEQKAFIGELLVKVDQAKAVAPQLVELPAVQFLVAKMNEAVAPAATAETTAPATPTAETTAPATTAPAAPVATDPTTATPATPQEIASQERTSVLDDGAIATSAAAKEKLAAHLSKVADMLGKLPRLNRQQAQLAATVLDEVQKTAPELFKQPAVQAAAQTLVQLLEAYAASSGATTPQGETSTQPPVTNQPPPANTPPAGDTGTVVPGTMPGAREMMLGMVDQAVNAPQLSPESRKKLDRMVKMMQATMPDLAQMPNVQKLMERLANGT